MLKQLNLNKKKKNKYKFLVKLSNSHLNEIKNKFENHIFIEKIYKENLNNQIFHKF